MKYNLEIINTKERKIEKRLTGESWLLCSPKENGVRINKWDEFKQALFSGYGKIMNEFSEQNKSDKFLTIERCNKVIKSWYDTVFTNFKRGKKGWEYSFDAKEQIFADYLGGGGGIGGVVHFNQANSIIVETKEVLINNLFRKYIVRREPLNLHPALRYISTTTSEIIKRMKNEQTITSKGEDSRPIGTLAYFLKFIGNILKGATKVRIAQPNTAADVFFYIEDLFHETKRGKIRKQTINKLFEEKDISKIYFSVKKKLDKIRKILGDKEVSLRVPMNEYYPRVDMTKIHCIKQCKTSKQYRKNYLKGKNGICWIEGKKYIEGFKESTEGFKELTKNKWWLNEYELYFYHTFGGWYEIAGTSKKEKKARKRLHKLYSNISLELNKNNEETIDLFSMHINAHTVSSIRFRECEYSRKINREKLEQKHGYLLRENMDRFEAKSKGKDIEKILKQCKKEEIKNARKVIFKCFKKKSTKRKKLTEATAEIVKEALKLISEEKAKIVVFFYKGKRRYKLLMSNKYLSIEPKNTKCKTKKSTKQFKLKRKEELIWIKKEVKKIRSRFTLGQKSLSLHHNNINEAAWNVGSVPLLSFVRSSNIFYKYYGFT